MKSLFEMMVDVPPEFKARYMQSKEQLAKFDGYVRERQTVWGHIRLKGELLLTERFPQYTWEVLYSDSHEFGLFTRMKFHRLIKEDKESPHWAWCGVNIKNGKLTSGTREFQLMQQVKKVFEESEFPKYAVEKMSPFFNQANSDFHGYIHAYEVQIKLM